MKTTLPKTILNLLAVHLEPMAAHAAKSTSRSAIRCKDGTGLLVGSGGDAYKNFTRANPEFTGKTIVVAEWYVPEGHDSDGLSFGPAVSMLPPRPSPIVQHIMTIDDARILLA